MKLQKQRGYRMFSRYGHDAIVTYKHTTHKRNQVGRLYYFLCDHLLATIYCDDADCVAMVKDVDLKPITYIINEFERIAKHKGLLMSHFVYLIPNYGFNYMKTVIELANALHAGNIKCPLTSSSP